jgi:hypothetical protein
MFSYTWAMSIFGLQQVVNLLTPENGDAGGKAAQAFDNVTEATTKTLGGAMKEAYKAGDSLQKGMVDLMFGGCVAGGLDPNRWVRAGNDALKRMTDLGREATHRATQAAAAAGAGPAATNTGNWGPMPR